MIAVIAVLMSFNASSCDSCVSDHIDSYIEGKIVWVFTPKILEDRPRTSEECKVQPKISDDF